MKKILKDMVKEAEVNWFVAAAFAAGLTVGSAYAVALLWFIDLK